MAEVERSDLKEDLKRLQKKPLRFAFGIQDAQTFHLLLHKTKTARALANEARSKRGAKTVTFGTASGEGKRLTLRVEGPELANLDKRVRHFLRKEKLTLYTEVVVERADEVGLDPAALGGDAAAAANAIAAAKAATKAPPRPPPKPLTSEENERLADLSSDELRATDLTQRDPKELFTEDYMDDLVGLKIPGANDPKLKDVMRELEKGATGKRREELIAQLARIRGKDPKKLDVDYGRFLVLRDQQRAIQKRKKSSGKDVDVVPDLAEDLHGEFLASNPQLVFGKVVGDAFGIDPIFGALLSPTGGMVGPGNMALHLDDDDPTGYHGIVHDAAGYLYNYHDQGPGYDYLGREDRATADPLTGQQSGMRYWHEKLDPGAGTTVMLGVIDVVAAGKDGWDESRKLAGEGAEAARKAKVEVEKALEEARDEVAEAIEEAMRAAEREVDEATAAVERAARDAAEAVEEAQEATRREIEKAARDVAEAAEEAAEAVEKATVEAVEDAKRAVENATEEAAEKLQAAWSYVFD